MTNTTSAPFSVVSARDLAGLPSGATLLSVDGIAFSQPLLIEFVTGSPHEGYVGVTVWLPSGMAELSLSGAARCRVLLPS